MRKWWKKFGVLAGGLLGLGGLLAPVQAQFGPAAHAPGGGLFAGDPDPGSPADFPNPAHKSGEPVSPFSLRDNGAPGAFTDLDTPAAVHSYVLTFRTEYLSWWMSRFNLPGPLVTTTSDNTVDPRVTPVGLPGDPNTVVLLGPGRNDYGAMGGGRITMGLAPPFMPPLEVSGLFFNRNAILADLSSNGSFYIIRPIQQLNAPNQVNMPADAGFIVAGPTNGPVPLGPGTLRIESRFNLWALDADLFVNFADNGTIQMDFLFGYKHAELNETLNFAEAYRIPGSPFAGVPNGLPAGATATIGDDFAVRNHFDGGTLGLRTRIGNSYLALTADMKLSLGRTHEILAIAGGSTAGGLGVPGGILALNSNSGITSHNDFSIIPEVNIGVSCQIYSNIRVFGGYNLLYWSHVGRPADQVSTAVDTTQVPTDFNFVPAHIGSGPVRTFRSTNFFGHGVNIGIEIGF